MKLLYEGKAKQLFRCENENEVYVHYKDSFTALNGKRKEEMESKGILNNSITAIIFKYLNDKGIKTHFIKKVNETDQICKLVKIIPLEVIIRNIATGSMSKKYGIEDGKKLKRPVFELCYKNDDLDDPLLNDDHVFALEIIDEMQLAYIKKETKKINELLKEFFLKANLILVDFKIEFGITDSGEIILADEISPDTCRLWDINTLNKLDKDRFRNNLGDVIKSYEEVLRRIENAWN